MATSKDMSTEETNILAVAEEQANFAPQHKKRPRSWYVIPRSPLWLCLLFALLIRVWLIYHTHGVIDGDEAMVGIQAEHILHGEHPIYFYGQAYMGSLEAYLMAVLFAIAGPSVWMLRAEPTLLSLLVVYLTWRLAGALAETASLSPPARQLFQTVAALCAAVPPLYDTVLELRTLGGYIETFVLMLLLLLSALQLTRRWHAGASHKELALRWAGIGFIVGLGFWVNPLLVSAVLAAGLWIVGFCLWEIACKRASHRGEGKRDAEFYAGRVFGRSGAARRGGSGEDVEGGPLWPPAVLGLMKRVPPHPTSGRPQGPPPLVPSTPAPTRSPAVSGKPMPVSPPCGDQAPHTISTFLLQCTLALMALPASLLGAAPALYWGFHNHWANITYIRQLGDLKLLDMAIRNNYHSRLELISAQIMLYQGTVAPRVISGSLPAESTMLAIIHIFTLYVGLICLLALLLFTLLSLFWHCPLLLRARRLVALPLLFAACTALTFCTSTITSSGLISPQHDLAGRYATPLMLVLPFFLAGVFTLVFDRSVFRGLTVFGQRTSMSVYTGRFFGRSQNSRRGGHGVGWGPLWPPVGGVEQIREGEPQRAATRAPTSHPSYPRPYAIIRLIVQGGLFATLLLYLAAHIATFGLTDAGATFQSPSCLIAPADNDALIAYLQQEDVHYGWADAWLANPIVFKTNGSIILVDPHPILYQQGLGRLPTYTQAVLNADRPAILTFVRHSEPHPLLLQVLDKQQISYHAKRFPALRGYDVLVVTGLSRKVSLAGSREFMAVFPYCAVYG